MNRVTFGHNNGISCAPLRRDQGWGTKIGLQNVPGPDKLCSTSGDYLDRTVGMGRVKQLLWNARADRAPGEGYYQYGGNGTMSHLAGSHNLKVGGDYRTLGVTSLNYGASTGTYSFTGTFTNNALADLMLGYPASGNVPLNTQVDGFVRYYSGYAQDDWRVNNKLTVNYGVRYEYTPPTWEGHFPDGYSNFNPDLANPAGRAPRRVGVRRRRAGPHRRDVALRRLAVGLQPARRVYSLDENTVVVRGAPSAR
jgi:outer membrane receptor protein involved in Fe transport